MRPKPAGGDSVAWLTMGLRVSFVGIERVLLRLLGDDTHPLATSVLFFGTGALLLLPLARPWTWSDWSYLRWALPNGVLYALAYAFYVSALSTGEVSVIAPLGSTVSVFVIVFAFLVYAEPLGWGKCLGALFVTGGAVTLQPGRNLRQSLVSLLQPGPGRAMLIYALLTSVTRILDKGASASGVSPATYACTVFATVAGLQALWLLAQGLGREILQPLQRQPVIALCAGVCNAFSFLLLIEALHVFPVSIAEPLTAFSLLVSAGVAAVFLGERLAPRILPTLGIIAGTWLLAIGVGPGQAFSFLR